MDILPEFDPRVNNSVDAEQFVQRVESLKTVYDWSERLVLFGDQTKLKGPAKLWMDSTKSAYTSWKRPRKIVKDILLNGELVGAFIDPGSDKSLVRESAASNLSTCKPLTFNGFAGGSFICTTKMKACMKIDDQTISMDLYVVDDNLLPNTLLLGLDCLHKNSQRVIIEPQQCRIERIEPLPNLGDSLSSTDWIKIREVISKFRQCFAESTSEMGKCKTAMMKIKLTSNKPVQIRPYCIPLAKRAKVEEITSKLLANGIIRPSNSVYSSPIVLIQKQNGEDRLCVDFRAVNALTEKQPYLMPTVEEQLSQISGNNLFTTLDLFSGYYQIPLEEESRQYTAFITHCGHYEFNVMPFGLINAPMVFQQMVVKLIKKLNSPKIVSYMDEVIIASVTVAEGLTILTKFLTLINEAGLTLRPSKCVFFAEELAFLGHRINSEGIRPGDKKVEAVKNFAEPTNVTEVRRFLGLTGFFRKFIKDYASISRPLTSLLKSENKLSFEWSEAADKSFQRLKELLCCEPVLTLYNLSAEHEIHTDASSLGLAGILLQSTEQGKWAPVFYFSRHCTDTERNYHSHELEVLAIVETLNRFRFFLLGKRFRVVTDCGAVSTRKLTTPLMTLL